jgi:hypothetical protein
MSQNKTLVTTSGQGVRDPWPEVVLSRGQASDRAETVSKATRSDSSRLGKRVVTLSLASSSATPAIMQQARKGVCQSSWYLGL